jgi:hypothetical protein
MEYRGVPLVIILFVGCLTGWYNPCIQRGSWGGCKPSTEGIPRWHVVLAGHSSW